MAGSRKGRGIARILVIDDEASIRTMLQQMLEGSGHEVAVAAQGAEGLTLFGEHPVDLVITDIFMPEKEGIETILELRQRSPQTKIIAISGGGRAGNLDILATAKNLGAHQTLAKPFERQELLDAVNAALA